MLKTLQSLCLLYLQTFAPKNLLHAALKLCSIWTAFFYLYNGKRAVLCLFLMSLPALRHERNGAKRAGKAVPRQPHSYKVPWVIPVSFSVSTTHRKVCLTRVALQTCRNLAAILGNTSKLFYPEAFTGDGHFAEGSLAPESGVGDAQHLQHFYSNYWNNIEITLTYWKWCSGLLAFFPDDYWNNSQP